MRADGAELLRDETTLTAAERIRAPLRLLRAPRGLLDDENPLIPSAVRNAFAAARPEVVLEDVPDVNHYTIMLGAGAGRVTAALGAAIDAARRNSA